MKILKIIGIVLAAVIVLIGIAILMQPAQGHVEKSIVINASPALVFREVNGFKSLTKWSPWAKLDPGAAYTSEGPETGVGAKISWAGEKVGKGSQVIEISEENQKVRTALTFEGFDGTAYSEFVITPQGAGTNLTWTYDAPNPGLKGKAMWFVMGGMMEDMYIQGLVDLKAYLESLPAEM